MKEVKTKVDAILYNSILNGSVLYLEAFQGAVFGRYKENERRYCGHMDIFCKEGEGLESEQR